MKTEPKKVFSALLFMSTVLLLDHPAVASQAQVPTEKARSIAFEQMVKRIDAAAASKDSTGAENLAKEIQADWVKAEPDRYGILMDKVCDAILYSDLYNQGHESAVAEKYALLALKRKEMLPVLTEADLVGYLLPVESKFLWLKTGKDQNLARYRALIASNSLHILGRIATKTNPRFDFSKVPMINIAPPVGAGLDSGSSPEDVADPKLRAEFEANIKANDATNAKYREQQELKSIHQTLVPHLERYIVDLYSMHPYNQQELNGLLKTYAIDAPTRKRILDQVAKNTGPIKKSSASDAP